MGSYYFSNNQKHYEKLLIYLQKNSESLSKQLLELLFTHSLTNNGLIQNREVFFLKLDNQYSHLFLQLIRLIESEDIEELLLILKDNNRFMLMLAEVLKVNPEIRLKLIENSKGIDEQISNMLRLILLLDEGENSQALNYLKKFDLSNISYVQARPLLEVAVNNEAWEFAIPVLDLLIEKEEDLEEKFRYKLDLISYNYKLGNYKKAFDLGEEILLDSDENLNKINIEDLLRIVFISYLQLGQNQLDEARKLFLNYSKYSTSLDFILDILSSFAEKFDLKDEFLELLMKYIANDLGGNLHKQDYVKIFFIFLRLNINIDLTSLNKVSNNNFFKFKDDDEWTYLGDQNCLDASENLQTSEKYNGVKIGDYDIEQIYSFKQYLFFRSKQIFFKLTSKNKVPGVKQFSILDSEGEIDLKTLENSVKEYTNFEIKDDFFNLYIKDSYPLAMLADSEGGLSEAIGRIRSEGKGFINSTINLQQIINQKQLIKNIIEHKQEFYLDATSLIFLCELDLFGKFKTLLPNMRVTRSTLNFIYNTSEKYSLPENHQGVLKIINGKLTAINISEEEKLKLSQFQNILYETLRVLELEEKNIDAITKASKVESFSEMKIAPELSDTCVLAQEKNIPIMTDDHIYLQMNNLETQKGIPEHFSIISFIEYLKEETLIDFNEYLKYFNYLSRYRFKFLSLNIDLLMNTIFGDSLIRVFTPEKLRLLNLKMTLSMSYGVQSQSCLNFLSEFIFQLIKDSSVTFELLVKIISVIQDELPPEYSAYSACFIKLVIDQCNKKYRELENNTHLIHINKETEIQKKLTKLNDIYGLTVLAKYK